MCFETALSIQSVDMLLERSDTVTNITDSGPPNLQQFHLTLCEDRGRTWCSRKRCNLTKHFGLAEHDGLITRADVLNIFESGSSLTVSGDVDVRRCFWI